MLLLGLLLGWEWCLNIRLWLVICLLWAVLGIFLLLIPIFFFWYILYYESS